jgi:pyruvate/2-oxoglutarate/acetoin dehydrogenase E1 component
MAEYFDELCLAMKGLSQNTKSIFVGQGVGCAGTTMTDTLKHVPEHKLLEFPVAEDLQTGFCIGLSLEGYLPICIFPRWNFLICATNQIINHLDRLPIYGNGYKPKVIIRVAVPITDPFDPGPQHDDDFTAAFRRMVRKIKIIVLPKADDIVPAYRWAEEADVSTLLVEFTGEYGKIPSGVPERKKEAV